MYKKSKKLKEIRDNVDNGAGLYNACKSAGISPITLWLWRRKDRRIENYIQALLGHRTTLVEDALFKNALSGNVVAQIFWLKNRGTDWRDAPLIDQSHNYTVKIVEANGNTDRTAQKPANRMEGLQ